VCQSVMERMPNPKQQIFRQMLPDQLEADWRATLVEAAVHGQRRHPGRVERCGVAQCRREIPLRHFIPFRDSRRRCGHHWDQQNIDIPEHVRDLTGKTGHAGYEPCQAPPQ
jgi:hypothetical protein